MVPLPWRSLLTKSPVYVLPDVVILPCSECYNTIHPNWPTDLSVALAYDPVTLVYTGRVAALERPDAVADAVIELARVRAACGALCMVSER